MPVDLTFGEMLRAERARAGKSLGELAKHLSLSTMYISDIERGRRGPLDNVQTVEAAKFLGIDPTGLLKVAAQHRSEVTVKVESNAALDLLTSLARGKRPDKTYRDLLAILNRKDKEE